MEPDPLDGLTGLLNVCSLDRRLTSALASHNDGSGIVAVILADMDGLQLINDTFGHSAGDEVLKRVATLLQALTQDEAVVFRFGGDEFIALCTATTELRAQQLAVQIENEVASLVVNWEGQKIGPISISTGLAFCPPDGRSADDLFRAADVAMYRNKHGDHDPPTTPVAVAKQGPKPRPPTDARARFSENDS